MALYSFLYWTQARKQLDLQPYPEFTAFLENFKDALGIAETNFI
jgi:hypothetical protein